MSTATSKRRTYRLTAPIEREHPLQTQIAGALKIEIAWPGKVSRHGVVWFSVDHANYAGEVPGVRTARGIIAGIWDIFVIHQGRIHWIEVKADDGKLSDDQMRVGAAVLMAGGKLGVAREADEALACLDEWGIPRAHRIQRIAA